MSMETEPASERAAPDPAAALSAVATCLRHLACGYGLLAAERAAALALLDAGIPGVCDADLEAAAKILRSARRLSGRLREKASELSVRLTEQAAAAVR